MKQISLTGQVSKKWGVYWGTAATWVRKCESNGIDPLEHNPKAPKPPLLVNQVMEKWGIKVYKARAWILACGKSGADPLVDQPVHKLIRKHMGDLIEQFAYVFDLDQDAAYEIIKNYKTESNEVWNYRPYEREVLITDTKLDILMRNGQSPVMAKTKGGWALIHSNSNRLRDYVCGYDQKR